MTIEITMDAHITPIALAPQEGSEWQPWVDWVPGEGTPNLRTAHAILFEDGSVFDTVNGWRGGEYQYTEAQIESLRQKGMAA